MGIHASKGWLTQIQQPYGFRKGRPIFDWSDGDVWTFIREQAVDYNIAYDAFVRQGINRAKMRIAPPAMSRNSITDLRVARATWPEWHSRLCDRLPGVREATIYGRPAFTPTRRLGQTWEETFIRTCIEEAPRWISVRSKLVHKRLTKLHAAHSTVPLSQDKPGCPRCGHMSWKKATEKMYMGDPFCSTMGWWLGGNNPVEADTFREGAPKWGIGAPAW
jgi:3'-phosphoadenosine 5'-phosphosulfate sulfotransferase (PAPS reductase)/FAD synthetase